MAKGRLFEHVGSGLLAIASITALAAIAAPGIARTQPTGAISVEECTYVRSMVLDGNQARLRITNPGRIARPVCASTLKDLMETRGGSSRLPDEIYPALSMCGRG